MTLNVNVHIPGLTALVMYLRERDQNQDRIEALAKRLQQATARLKLSTAALSAAVQSQQSTADKE